jgi:hypothetical protein
MRDDVPFFNGGASPCVLRSSWQSQAATSVMVRMEIAEWLRTAAAGGWRRLGLGLSALWAALVLLLALASSDPGQNYVARLLIVPIAMLWCSAYAVRWISRTLRREHAQPPPSSPVAASAASFHKPRPAVWWASALICIAAIVGAFTLHSGPNGNDLLHQLARLAGSVFVIAVLATVVYRAIRPRTSAARAGFLLATAFVGAAFVLWQAFDDTRRVGLPQTSTASGPAESAASSDKRAAERSGKSAKARRQQTAPEAAQSELSANSEWATALSEAMRRHDRDYQALASKWDSDVGELRFESMLTPETLTSSQGRMRNHEQLMRFEALLADYLARLDMLQRDYRSDVLAIDIPKPQRESFLEEFEGAFRASAAETKELNAEFERVELEIAGTILAVTDLMEREGDAVTVGSDGKTLLFERDAAADEYNALLKALEKTTEEEAIVMAKSSEAFQKRTASLNAAADLQ